MLFKFCTIIFTFLSFSFAINVVDKGEFLHPFHSDSEVRKDFNGYQLDRVLVHTSNNEGTEQIQNFKIKRNEENHAKLKRTLPTNRGEYVKLITMLQEQSYPNPEKLEDNDSEGEVAYRKDIHQQIINRLLEDNITIDQNAEQYFLGSQEDDGSKDQVGVQVLIWTHPLLNDSFFVFRGSYSDQDVNLNGVLFSRYYDYQVPEYSKKRWEDIGESTDDLSSNSIGLKYLLRFAATSFLVDGSRTEFDTRLAEAGTGIDEETLVEQRYFALALQIVDEGIKRYPNTTVWLSGHSLSGSYISQVSAHIFDRDNIAHPTINFGSVGGRCTGQEFLGFPVDKTYDHIVTYIDPMDVATMVDYHHGTVCWINTQPESKESCQPLIGAGIELISTKLKQFSTCRKTTHQIYHFFEDLVVEGNIDENGVTPRGCDHNDFPIEEGCPTFDTDPGYIVFMIFIFCVFAFLILCCCCLCLLGCRACYLCFSDDDGDLIPFSICCCKCGKGAV